ncbi:MAG: glycerol-3-phosphate 1-O-acyltransferase PlsY [Nitrospinae bacterium]|nr:glycerol-3-phosphate 1-O-acyltransferase PlsY [Nitrospinota bacterium]
MNPIVLWAIAYLIGAIPCGVLIARTRKIDIREHGSGNIGATNVARVIGKKEGALTLAGDCAKGTAAVALAAHFMDSPFKVAVAALMAFLGHLFSIFLKFKGGKGVATGLGIFLYLMPLAALSSMAVFAAALSASRYVSLSSILAAVSLPLFGIFYKMPPAFIYASAIVSAMTIVKHRGNIQRLLAGAESKFGEK